jgi:hypothetical protein
MLALRPRLQKSFHFVLPRDVGANLLVREAILGTAVLEQARGEV